MIECDKLIGVVTSMKPGGLILSIGAQALPVQPAVVASMDMFSRLVVNLPPDLPFQEQESSLGDDLRVAIHRQGPVSFLQDVKHHKTNMAIVGSKDLDEELLRLIIEMLDEAGCLVVIDRPDDETVFESILDAHGRHVRIDSMTVFAKVKPQTPRGRKGGRRSRGRFAQGS